MRLADGAETITQSMLVAAFKEHRTGYAVADALGISYQTLRTLLGRFLKQGFDVRARAGTPAKVGHPVVHGRAVGWREKGRDGYQAPSETPEGRATRKQVKLAAEKKEAARKKRAAKKRAAKKQS